MDPDLHARLVATFRWVDPGAHSPHLISDRSGWWRDPVVLRGVGPALAGLFADEDPTVVVAPEVTGFLVGPLVAVALGVGFVEAYKHGRDQPFAEPVTWAQTHADYRGRRLGVGIRSRRLDRHDRVLLVDDWVATGAQLRALRQVVSTLGARTVGTAAILADCPTDVAAELRVRALLSATDLRN